MPNFAELMRKGCSGVLKSTTPPYTPPAWSSFYTGVNPGKHGIYGFTRINPATGQRELTNLRAMGARKIWQIINEHGFRTGLVNLPLTYPPEPVEGYLVTGLMTPEHSRHYTYPRSLVEELGSLGTPYFVDVSLDLERDVKNTRIVKKLLVALRGRRAAIQHLLKRHPCDFVVVVFVELDRLQHVYWKYIDENCALYNTARGEKFRAEIETCYRELDDSLGDIAASLGNDAQLYIISDHGFTELRSEFFLNNWLAQEGFFALNSSSRMMLKPLYGKLRSSKLVHALLSKWYGKVREQGLNQVVDWEHTDAYAREQGLFMNLKGREEHGSLNAGEDYEEKRELIKEKLSLFANPQTGERMVDSIYFKEEIYEGPYLDVAPDIIPVLGNYTCSVNEGVLRREVLSDCSAVPYGVHDPNGVIVAYGRGISAGETIGGASIVDVAPTLLHVMGLPVPDDMDGKVLIDLFDENFKKQNPLRTTMEDIKTQAGGEEVYSQKEAAEIEEQLRGLGYLG